MSENAGEGARVVHVQRRLEHEPLAARQGELVEHRRIHATEALPVIGRGREANGRLDALPVAHAADEIPEGGPMRRRLVAGYGDLVGDDGGVTLGDRFLRRATRRKWLGYAASGSGATRQSQRWLRHMLR